MADIGRPIRRITVVPLDNPLPQGLPEEPRRSEPVPEKVEPVKEPA